MCAQSSRLTEKLLLSFMGVKHVCFACRKAVNVRYAASGPARCTDCSSNLVVLPHRFRPPKKRETEKWATAQYLVEQGFFYQHLNPADFPGWASGGYGHHVRYPEKLKVAKAFVAAFRVIKRKAL